MHCWRFAILLGLIFYQCLFAPFFSHDHMVNGVRIVHEHPYAAAHDHSDQAYLTIDLANTTTGIAEEQVAIPVAFLLFSYDYALPETPEVVRAHGGYVALRAPPVDNNFMFPV